MVAKLESRDVDSVTSRAVTRLPWLFGLAITARVEGAVLHQPSFVQPLHRLMDCFHASPITSMHFLKVMFYLSSGYTQDKIPLKLFNGHIKPHRVSILRTAFPLLYHVEILHAFGGFEIEGRNVPFKLRLTVYLNK